MLCSKCGAADATPSHKWCAPCREANNQRILRLGQRMPWPDEYFHPDRGRSTLPTADDAIDRGLQRRIKAQPQR